MGKIKMVVGSLWRLVQRLGVPGLTWAVLVFGMLLLGSVWVVVVWLGDGIAEPWHWGTGSWQAVATGLTGFALVVFASVQVAVMRRMWLDERGRWVTLRVAESVRTRQETLRLLRSVQLRFHRLVGEQQLLVDRVRNADVNTGGLFAQKHVDLLRGLDVSLKSFRAYLGMADELFNFAEAQIDPTPKEIALVYEQTLNLDAMAQFDIVPRGRELVDLALQEPIDI